jgi:hypothetical protein
MTGILDRLQRGGWVSRDRGPKTAGPSSSGCAASGRGAVRLYAGMNSSLDRICAGYGGGQLELLADPLRRATDAGRSATGELAAD